MALQTARKWIDGKNRDLAYVIANELFHNQFKEIEETNKNEVDSHEKPTQDIITIPNRMNATPHMAFYYNHLESLKNDYQRQSDRVITNYNKLKSYKWILKTTHLNNIERLIYLRKEQVFMFNEFTKLYDDMFKQTPFGLDEIEIFNEQAKALQNHHEKIKESFQDNSVFDILHLENLSPDQYFEITH
ncbi:hypothetical protein [Pantoea sp. CTOTU46764]|uniref:hypothetical protein n=1 Tax=Pantoea sp. CTOTU46764 TaxID=2953854 RepID=UPI00289EDAC1|nr:hypothetical protein [Pantoea sp. CTOTU46764]